MPRKDDSDSLKRLERGCRVVTNQGVFTLIGRPEEVTCNHQRRLRLSLCDAMGHRHHYFDNEIEVKGFFA